ncbi:hypothetical protein Tco_1335962 [Tanacetum coccineum]
MYLFQTTRLVVVLRSCVLINKGNALGYSNIPLTRAQIWGVKIVTMSSATSDVTYTSVYTDSEPGRAFWGADDEEVSEGGIPRVIILGYDGLPLQPVAHLT